MECKHKGAADSINWFVNLLKGKHGEDRKTTLEILSQMLHEMKEHQCKSCNMKNDCHELDAAFKSLVQEPPRPKESIQGSLSLKREHSRKTKLIRPHGR